MQKLILIALCVPFAAFGVWAGYNLVMSGHWPIGACLAVGWFACLELRRRRHA